MHSWILERLFTPLRLMRAAPTNITELVPGNLWFVLLSRINLATRSASIFSQCAAGS